MPLFDLGEDIITNEIIPNLSPKDIHSLGLTCHYLHSVTNESTVWHQLYEKTFGVAPTPFAFSVDKWPNLFKLRKNAKLMTWGKSSGGRLGYSVRDVPENHVSHRSLETSINTPSLVKHLQETIVADVSAGGFSFQILTNTGELYTTGVTWNGGLSTGPSARQRDNLPGLAIPTSAMNLLYLYRAAPGQLLRPLAPTVMPGIVIHDTPPVLSTDTASSPDKPDTSSGFIRKLQVSSKIVAVSSGRTHFIALDANGDIWTWDNPRQGLLGLKLKFIDSNGVNLLSNKNFIAKIVAGWNFSCCYIENIGLVYWKSRENFVDSSLSVDDNPVNANFELIPNIDANLKIIDFVAGDSFIVYLTNHGKIYRVDIDNSNIPYELTRFNSYLIKHSKSSSATPTKFIRLSGGSFKTFVAISDEDQVLIGTKDSNVPQVLQDLQYRKIISVAMGDYHYLALNEDGDLYSWGLESQNCGCLGLGDSHAFIETSNGNGEMVGRNGFKVNNPTKVKTNGKVLAIGAAGWQSCAIVSSS